MIIGNIVDADQRAFRDAIARAMGSKDPRIWLAELVANARQSGAREIRIQVTGTGENTTRVEVGDDGHGVLDADALASYGTSAWSDLHATDPRPSGCGLATLAPLGVTLHGAADRIVLSPEVLHGQGRPQVIRCPRASHRDGTTAEVIVPHDVAAEAAIVAIAQAMAERAAPAALYVNGEPAAGPAKDRRTPPPRPAAHEPIDDATRAFFTSHDFRWSAGTKAVTDLWIETVEDAERAWAAQIMRELQASPGGTALPGIILDAMKRGAHAAAVVAAASESPADEPDETLAWVLQRGESLREAYLDAVHMLAEIRADA